ncbi:MAG: hypothetical protein HGA45_39625 [Chloroflexales bacterium]|nr:hypothetical protein [Chloroflexales bacterium]
MAATTTVLFSQSDVQALMIIEPKTPRFEITQAGAVKQSFPATRSWKKEQQEAVEAAQALLADRPAAKVTTLLTELGHPILAEGEKPTKKAASLKLPDPKPKYPPLTIPLLSIAKEKYPSWQISKRSMKN